MSIDALQWAFKLQIRPATRKLVLIALADYASDDGLCWPSAATLAEKTSLDDKTVRAAIADLEKHKLLTDTGRRMGATRQVPIWRIAVGAAAPPELTGAQKVPKNGQVSEGDEKGTRFSPGKVPEIPAEDTRFSGERYPKTDNDPPVEPAGIPQDEPPLGGDVADATGPQEAQSPSSEKTGPSRKPREGAGTRLPADWQPDNELLLWSHRSYSHINPLAETEKFRDFWLSKAGPDARKVDWDRTFKTWIRRAADDWERRHPQCAGPPNSTMPPAASGTRTRPRRPTEAEALAELQEDLTDLFQEIVDDAYPA